MWIFTALSRIVLAGVFWVAVRLFYKVEIHGLERAKGKYIHEQAVSLTAANRFVDQRLLYPHTIRKLARSYLQYAHRQDSVHTLDSHTWAPKISNLTFKVAPGDVGYRQAPLAYAWNELQEMLSVHSLEADSIPVMQ